MKTITTLILLILLITTLSLSAQDIERVEPPFWWAGMENQELQILVYGEDIAEWNPSINSDMVKLQTVTKVENPNYLFLKVTMAENVKAGSFDIQFEKGRRDHTVTYELKERQQDFNHIDPLNPSDLIYLIMPDRFANGNPENDQVEGMRDMSLNRDSLYYRHGGDIQGVINHLDYLEELGSTALWLNPVIENDEEHSSYHGYAMTDLYKVDPRLGSNELFKALSDSLQERNMKMVMDVIHNHWGVHHWMIRDLPMDDWIHQWDTFTKTTYRAPTMLDPHGSKQDRKLFLEGWFDNHMADLNQDNPLLATYLIQNNIWWIEYAGLDGFRMDTYAYSDPDFLEKWGQAILREYPGFFMFGETWVHGVPIQAYFGGETKIDKDFDSKVQGLTDFQLYYAINEALTEDAGWTSGVNKLYYTLAKDFLYDNPMNNVVFLDNHDLSRFFSVVEEDLDKFKMGIGFLLTVRGIPSIYYGTEILMSSHSDGHGGTVRRDFPGGWEGDETNKFKASGRTVKEMEAFSYVKHLANWRQQSEAITEGKMMHFVPQDGVYVYFRYTDDECVMGIFNPKEEAETIQTGRFQERMKVYDQAVNVVTGEKMNQLSTIDVPAKTLLLLDLRK